MESAVIKLAWGFGFVSFSLSFGFEVDQATIKTRKKLRSPASRGFGGWYISEYGNFGIKAYSHVR